MIVYGGPAAAVARRGEFHPFPGARSRCRAIPYPGFEAESGDPWKGTFGRAADVETGVGPADAGAWLDAIARAAPGKVLVGTVAPAEEVYGAAAMAVAAAREAGRSVILVETVESRTDAAGGPDLARVVLWEARLDFWTRFARRREPGGVAVAVIPGWTGTLEFLERTAASARAAGARFLAPFELGGDGPSRAAIHSAYAALEPRDADAFFDAIHHRDWSRGTRESVGHLRRAAADAGLPARVPAIAGAAEFSGNARLIEAIEIAAETAGEPRASDLLAAARRLEDLGRDVEEIARDGNLRLLFPPDSPEGRIAGETFSLRPA
jgi:hypothetical protein